MKTLTSLLAHRADLLRQVRLAHLAFAHVILTRFEQRVARAGLTGSVTLRPAVAEEGVYWATLTANVGAQSVIEEHFSDEDLMELADVMAFLAGRDRFELTFPIQELAGQYLPLLRAELERAGVEIDATEAGTDVPR